MKRALLLAAGGALSVSLGGIAIADVGRVDDSDPRALSLLRAASEAGRTSSYEGTQVVMLWRSDRQLSASVRISHRAGSGSLIQVEPTATTPARTVFEPTGQGTDGLTGPSAAALELVSRNYVVQLDGSDDVLGRMVDVVLIRSRSGRPVQRLWIDRQTALPLRRAFYDDQAQLVRQTAFVTLSERVSSAPSASVPTLQLATVPMRPTAGTIDAAALRADGWAVPAPPEGMIAYDAVVTGSDADAVLHLAYTDGIETVSLFEQRGSLDSANLTGWRRTRVAGVAVRSSGGYPRRVTWSAGDHVFTVVTECDQRSVEQLVGSLPSGHRKDGLAPRVGRGARRVASWINPTR